MAGGAGLLEYRLASWRVALELKCRLVLTDDFLSVGNLARQKGPGALPQFGVGVHSQLLHASWVDLSGQHTLLFHGIEQERDALRSCEHCFDHFATDSRA